ncbi:DUF5134 domain-containing protein [Amycolatopsis panacis]|uniref:DUF5134 domain-containing protein n=1 Tax=Amycolatopsis panacis TaxID=2340917 RepID=A0A419I1K3_9PSEU|nr:DUF5134 domain-containing protein [Amycolatopsis panacis]
MAHATVKCQCPCSGNEVAEDARRCCAVARSAVNLPLAWSFTVLCALLALPCVLRLVRLDYVRLGPGVRAGDLAELLLVIAMVAMLSPVGGPIPAAGWQAVLGLTVGWLGVSWWRERRSCQPSGCGHHALSALAMLYMVSAMPQHGAAHGPWLTMSTMDTGLAWPAAAVLAAYFAADALRAGAQAMRLRGTEPLPGHASRTWCRAAMGAGMGYLLLAAA